MEIYVTQPVYDHIRFTERNIRSRQNPVFLDIPVFSQIMIRDIYYINVDFFCDTSTSSQVWLLNCVALELY